MNTPRNFHELPTSLLQLIKERFLYLEEEDKRIFHLIFLSAQSDALQYTQSVLKDVMESIKANDGEFESHLENFIDEINEIRTESKKLEERKSVLEEFEKFKKSLDEPSLPM